ncbi:MAG: lysophospholipid acyltransferase family protein, partial [Caldilinea sp.]
MFLTAVKPLFCQLSIEGRENIPTVGGCILTCNHTMGPDFLVIGYLSPRQIYFMVKAELMEANRWLGQFLRYHGCFPIHRGEGDMGAVQHAINLVQSGRVLGMFPEGTRSRGPNMRPFHRGSLKMAVESKSLLVPVSIEGTYKLLEGRNTV